MSQVNWKGGLGLLLAGLLVGSPAMNLAASSLPLGKVIPRGAADLNGTRLDRDATVYLGDLLATAADGLAAVLFAKGDQLHVGPASEVRVITAEGVVVASLARGAVLARSGGGQTIAVRARGLLVRPQGAARYEVALADNAVLVASAEGAVTVQGINQAMTVPAGKAMRFELAPGLQAPAGAGAGAGIGPAMAAWIGVAAAGGALAVGWVVANELAKDARREACQQIKSQVSGASGITCQ